MYNNTAELTRDVHDLHVDATLDMLAVETAIVLDCVRQGCQGRDYADVVAEWENSTVVMHRVHAWPWQQCANSWLIGYPYMHGHIGASCTCRDYLRTVPAELLARLVCMNQKG